MLQVYMPLMNSSNLYVSHYAYQSRDGWNEKKKKGRVGGKATRSGPAPQGYNSIRDTGTLDALRYRIKKTQDQSLRHCLHQSFLTQSSNAKKEHGAVGTAVCLVGRAPPVANLSSAFNRRVRFGLNAEVVFRVNKYRVPDDEHRLVQWYDKRVPRWRESNRKGNYLGGLPGFCEKKKFIGDRNNLSCAYQLVDCDECLQLIQKAEIERGRPFRRIAWAEQISCG